MIWLETNSEWSHRARHDAGGSEAGQQFADERVFSDDMLGLLLPTGAICGIAPGRGVARLPGLDLDPHHAAMDAGQGLSQFGAQG